MKYMILFDADLLPDRHQLDYKLRGLLTTYAKGAVSMAPVTLLTDQESDLLAVLDSYKACPHCKVFFHPLHTHLGTDGTHCGSCSDFLKNRS